MTLLHIMLFVVLFIGGLLAGNAAREENWVEFGIASTIVVIACVLFWMA